jgi:gliding motility-associated-like protein
MKNFYHLLLSGVFLCLGFGLHAQTQSVTVTDATGSVGQEVCVDLVGRNFDNILGMQFSVGYDATVLEFVSAMGSVNGTAVSLIHNANNPGVIRASWNLFSSVGYTDDGPFTIATICFNILQESETVVDLTGVPIPNEFTDANSNIIPTDIFPGTINQGTGGGPSCNDGIQNGDETGVDCGGSCDPCTTCNDGVQNGDETGVDCGGSCDPCPTCNDGVQNGDETGVDCGGSCDPCPTCNDGIQNGDETGVDCGGSCAPCPTCNDGIQNGDETGVDCGGSCAPCEMAMDCGEGSPFFNLCLAEACDVAAGAQVCLDLSASRFTNVTALQVTIQYPGANLDYASISTNAALGDDILANEVSDGEVRLVYFQQSQAGVSITDGAVIGTICFTNETTNGTTLSLSNLIVSATTGEVPNPVANNGSVNNCGGTTPTCNDGIQNGDETGVDCGGSCAPCNMPMDCGEGSNLFNLCLGDACDVGVGAQTCLDLTASMFTNVTAMQVTLTYPGGHLDYASISTNSALGDDILANEVNDGEVRLVYFQQSQAGASIPDGDAIGTICFTNETSAATTINLSNLIVSATNGEVPNPVANAGSVNDCGNGGPSCSDGIQNGDETGVDCGGSCAPCGSTGGPDLNCGMGTNAFSFCLGDACDIPVNQTVCIDITVGNFDNITAFQTDLNYPSGSLFFQSITANAALVDPIQVNVRNSGELRMLYLQQSQQGVSLADGEIIATLCFTLQTPSPLVLSLEDLLITNTSGSVPNPQSSNGSINDCATTPTCNDGIQNGNETGIDCGGSCAPCNPGSDTCGEGSNAFNLCLDDLCDVAPGAQACLDLNVSMFTGITALQVTLNYPGANLNYASISTNPALGDDILANEVSDGEVRLVYFQQSQAGVTVADGESIGTICFTNETSNPTIISPGNLIVSATTGEVPNPVANSGSVNDCATGPTCNDGIQNGNETGVDCGGDCAPCPTCNDGIQNGNETGVDCGGDCAPCPTTTDCGSETTDVEVCLGSVCGDVGTEVCLPVFVGNFNSLGGLQLTLNYNGANLEYTRTVPNTALASGATAGNPSDGEIGLVWNDINLTGVTFPADEVAFEICFTVEVDTPTPVTFENSDGNPRAFDELGTRLPAVGNPGSINQNCGNEPTCNDGIQNGDETGVDCGGSCAPCPTCTDGIQNGDETGVDCGGSCAPCPTCNDGIQNGDETGVDCGGSCMPCDMGTNNCGEDATNFTLCLEEVCDVTVGSQVCLDLTASLFTDITALQVNVLYPGANLEYESITTAPALGDAILDNEVSDGEVRLVYFQQSQAGATVANGETIATICFTNQTAGATTIALNNLIATATTGAVPNPVANNGSINGDGCGVAPTCDDGIQNGDEEGIDCGGSNCAPCMTGGNMGDLNLLVGSTTGAIGQEVCVDVSANNFNALTGFAFTLNYDPSLVQLVSVTANGAITGLNAGSFDTSTSGEIGVNYANANPQALADGGAIFTVCFTVLGGEEVPLTLSGATATDELGAVTVNTTNGVINAGGVNFDNFTLVVGDGVGEQGEEVCLDVLPFNLVGLAGLQFAITYDTEKLQFNSAMGTGVLAGLQVSNPEPGVLRVIWFDINVMPNSVDDGTSILNACFTILDDCETEVEITDLPAFRIRATDANNDPVNPIDVRGGTVNAGESCGGIDPPENLVLELGTANGSVGSEVCLDLTATNFTSLTDLSFSFAYDDSILSFSRATGFGLGSITASNVDGSTPGQISFDWDAPTSSGQTLANGATLLQLCFTVDQFAPATVNFANSPVAIQAQNANAQNVGVIPTGGRVNPDAPIIDGLTLQISSTTAMMGETVCLPVLGFEATDLVAFQFTINYDPAILAFTGTGTAFAFRGLSAGSINNSEPGVLRVLWSDPFAEGNSVPDGEAIFTICFQVLSTSPGVVSFGDTPTAIEFENTSSIVEADLLNGQINGSAAPVIIGAEQSNPTCSDTSDGSIEITVSGGPDLTFAWDDDVSDTALAENLPAGTYCVTVTDMNTSQSTTSCYTLVAPPPFSLSVDNVEGVSCNGESDGAITIATVGGVGPFVIDWEGNLPDNVLTQTDLDGGDYSVTVTDANGCSREQVNIQIGEPSMLTIAGTPSLISTENPGEVNVIAQGGREPYTYSWTGPEGFTADSEDIGGLSEPGTYCLTLTDNNDCFEVQCFAVGRQLEIIDITVNQGCSEEDNGTIALDVVGGNGNYNYLWSQNDTTFANTRDVENLSPGDYSVTVTSGMQEATALITVEVPDPILAPGVVMAATTGDNGSIDITPSGGTPPYTYAWTDGPTDQDRNGLSSGEYCVVITDANGCQVTRCYTVGSAPIAFLTTSTEPTSCSDGEDGILRVVLENGVAPFTVRVEPLGIEETVDTSRIEIMVPAGTYQVFVTDAQSGMLQTELTVDAPPAITAAVDFTSDTEDTDCSGVISLDIAGGTAGYTVNWNTGEEGATIAQLCAGTYVATVIDANGCEFVSDSITVGRIDEEVVAITDVACADGMEGAIDVSISGGVAPYQFSWTRMGEAAVLAETEDISGLTTGMYTLTIEDATGARLVRNYTVGITAGFSVMTRVTSDYNGFGVSCPDGNDGQIVIDISGQGEFTYEFILNDVIVGVDSVLNDASPGQYTITVLDEGGCEIVSTVELTAPSSITLEESLTDPTCDDTQDGAISVTATGGVSPYTFAWSNGASSSRIQSLRGGNYTLTVTDANGCTMEESYTLVTPEPLAVTFEATDATDGCNGSIRILPLGGSGNYIYNWPQLPDQGNNPLAEGLCPGDYTLEVTDDNGCQAVSMVAQVLDRRFPCLNAREVITPNGDGLNETFIIFCSDGDEVSENNLEIYNRWGQLVFEAANYSCSDDDGSNCFEGRTNDGTLLPPGPYYYVLEYTNALGERAQQRGSLTIVRD